MTKSLSDKDLHEYLDEKYNKFDSPSFIETDPISIPHKFSKREDVEISGLISATIAWGQRKSIIKNANHFMALMDDSPYEFVKNHSRSDLNRFDKAVHRTFNGEDLKFFITSLHNIYSKYQSIEDIFVKEKNSYDGLCAFYQEFFSIPHLDRTRRHVANVAKGSAAKRLNMYLRWMVRRDKKGVDFGIWDRISMSDLYLPLDVHTGRISRMLGLLERKQNDWKAVEELTNRLKVFDPKDPVKYDFALFGVGVNEDFNMNDFHFKQFSIKHSSDVMKVGTDGVLLGAFIKPKNVKHILDIGTGSGLIALMLAQKSNANIVGIDINDRAIDLANYNFRQSKWSDRLMTKLTTLQTYVPNNKFDIVVSNPPFYDTDVYAPDERRAIARHSTELKFEDILAFCKTYLSDNGKGYFIYPNQTADKMIEAAQKIGLQSSSGLNIKSNYNSDIIRKIVVISPQDLELEEQTICIEKEKRHDFTPEYVELTKEYYLKF